MDVAVLGHVEVLINTIYGTGQDPAAVKTAQRELLAYQRGPDGWKLGQALLETNDPNAQFLGANTFLIKIHDNSAALPDQVRAVLLQWLQTAGQTPFKPFVTRKIMGAVITLFFRQYAEWPDFLASVAHILGQDTIQMLTLMQMLMEDYTRLQQPIHSLRSALQDMVPQVGSLIEQSLAQPDLGLKLQALDTFLPWATAFYHDLSPLLPAVIDILATDDFDLFDKTAAIIADLYPIHFKSWGREPKTRLQSMLAKLTTQPPEDAYVPLGRLVLVVATEDSAMRLPLLRFILDVLTQPEDNVLDDELANDVLEFWNVFVEDVIAEGMSAEHNDMIFKVIGIYWQRLQLFDMSESSWEQFSSFRRDFCDFLELTYSLLGLGLFDLLVSSIVRALQERDYAAINWREIEISLCCLNGLADIIGVEGKEFAAVQAVFSSSLWADLQHCKSLRVRQTAVNVIGCYDAFFESEAGRPFLSPTLTYLFASLTEPSLQNIASRSIQKLCASCRTALVADYPQFLGAYAAIYAQLQAAAHHRIVLSVGFILQAIENLDQQADAINEVLTILESQLAQPAHDVETLLDRLRCVAALGKALREPSDALVLTPEVEAALAFWPAEPRRLRERLMRIVHDFVPRPEPDVCETLCEIIKAGLSEEINTVFSFGVPPVLEFLTEKFQLGPPACRPPLVDLATFLVTSQAAARSLDKQTSFTVLQLVGSDAPDASLRLMTEIITKLPAGLLEFGRLGDLLEFAVQSMCFSDRFVLSAASKFWIRFLGTSEAMPALEHVGQQLVNAIVKQVSGDANRSDVEYHADVLRKLMARAQLSGTNWLRHSVIEAPVTERLAAQSDKARTDFVKQIGLLRGGRQTTQVVVKFWLHCRGLPEY